MDVEIFETKEFLKAVKEMKRAGGRKSRAADQVLAMRNSIALFENPFESLRKTKHGVTSDKRDYRHYWPASQATQQPPLSALK